MSVTQGSNGCNQILDANDGFDGPLYTLASEVVAKQRAATTEKVLKGARKVAKANPEAGEMTEPPTTKRKSRDVQLAENIFNSYRGRLACYGDQFYMLDANYGWWRVTEDVVRACTKARGKDGSRTIYPILQQFCCIPSLSEGALPTIYWQHSGKWDTKWTPYRLEKWQILFANGVYDCKTAEFEELPPEKIIFGPRLSVPYPEIAANYPDTEIEQMAERMFPDAEIRRHFQEVASQIMFPHHIQRGQVVLIGPTMCGKTTLATAIGCAPGGAQGKSDIAEASLAKDQWSRAQLLNKFINVSDDSPRVPGWPGFAKTYTSGRMVFRTMYRMPITVAATAKLWSTCNEMQDTTDASGAMGPRIIPFRVQGQVTRDGQDTDRMTDIYWSDWLKRMSVICWLLEGADRYWERGGYDEPAQWLDQKSVIDGEGDPLEGWLREHLVRAEDGDIEKRALEEKMPADLIPPGKSHKLSMYLERMFGATSTRNEKNGERVRVFHGVTWA